MYLAARFYIRVMHRPRGDLTAAILTEGQPCALRDVPLLLGTLGFPRSIRRRCAQRDNVPPWLSVDEWVSLDFGLSSTSPVSTLFAAHVDSHYPGYSSIFCDGSRFGDVGSSACGLYVPSRRHAVAWRLSPNHSVLSAELFAIYQALRLVECEDSPCWVIFSDSRVALQLLRSPTQTCADLVFRIRQLLLLLNERKRVCLQWVKAHAGIPGNERADAVAKLGHALDRTALFPLPSSDALALLRSVILRHWELSWIASLAETGKGLHLASLRSDLSPVPWVACRSRRVSVVLARFRMGHVGVRSYLYRFGMADTSTCLTCGVDDTIEHFLLSCTRYRHERLQLVAALQTLGVSRVTVRILLGGGIHIVSRDLSSTLLLLTSLAQGVSLCSRYPVDCK